MLIGIQAEQAFAMKEPSKPTQEDLTKRLGFSAFMDNVKEVERLIRGGADAKAVDKLGRTAMDRAIESDNGRIIVSLIKLGGINVNEVDKNGNLPLSTALNARKKGAVELLIKEGANVEALDSTGHTPLEVAESLKDREMLDVFWDALITRAQLPQARRQAELNNNLFNAIKSHNTQEVENLLAAGASVQARDFMEQTPLIAELSGWNKEDDMSIVLMLLKAGADINAQSRTYLKQSPKTPLLAAFLKNKIDAVRLLIESGAVIDPTQSMSTGIRNASAMRSKEGLRVPEDLLKAMTTSVSPAEIQHLIPTVIASVMKQNNTGKDIATIIANNVVTELVSEKLALAKEFLPKVPEAELRAAIEQSIQRVLNNTPKLQAAVQEAALQKPPQEKLNQFLIVCSF